MQCKGGKQDSNKRTGRALRLLCQHRLSSPEAQSPQACVLFEKRRKKERGMRVCPFHPFPLFLTAASLSPSHIHTHLRTVSLTLSCACLFLHFSCIALSFFHYIYIYINPPPAAVLTFSESLRSIVSSTDKSSLFSSRNENLEGKMKHISVSKQCDTELSTPHVNRGIKAIKRRTFACDGTEPLD